MARIRTVLVTLLFTVLGTVGLAGLASAADNYVPPTAPSTSVVVSSTTPAPAVDIVNGGGSSGDSLAYTGSGINIGASITIALIVLAVGIALVVLGSRLSRRNSSHS